MKHFFRCSLFLLLPIGLQGNVSPDSIVLKSEKLFENLVRSKDTTGFFDFCNQVRILNNYQAEKALDINLRALEWSQGQSEYVRAKAYNSLGNTYAILWDLEKSNEHYLQAYKLALKSHNFRVSIAALQNISLNFTDMQDFLNAEEYVIKAKNRALKLTKEGKMDGKMLMGIYTSLADCYWRHGKYDKAFETAKQALSQPFRDSLYFIDPYLTIGEYMLTKDSLANASKYFRKAIAIARNYNNHFQLAYGYGALVSLFLKKESYDSALYYLEKSEKLNYFDKGFYKYYYKVYKGKGQQKLAFEYLDKYNSYRDSLTNYNTISPFLTSQKKIMEEFKAEDEQQWLKQVGSLKQRNLVLAAGIFLVLLATMMVIVWKNRINKQKLKENQKVMREQLEKTSRDLAVYTAELLEKEKTISLVGAQLKKISEQELNGTRQAIVKTLKQIEGQTGQIQDKHWEHFKQSLEHSNQVFIAKMKKQFPNLTTSDLKLCALLRLNHSNKDVAKIMGITPSSAHKARYRLRKKLRLHRTVNLVDYFIDR